MKRVAIWGASGHASVVADVVRLEGKYDVAGFIVDDREHMPTQPGCSPIVGGREHLDSLRAAGVSMLIIGVGDCATRMQLAELVRNMGFSLATAIHPGAIVARGVHVGEGTVIVAGAVVNPGTAIGENVILNTSASVDHDCVIEDGAHVGPGCHLGGRVRVGTQAWLGIGTVVGDRITIGPKTTVGAGAVVVADLPAGVIAYGVPAKVVRSAP